MSNVWLEGLGPACSALKPMSIDGLAAIVGETRGGVGGGEGVG